MEVEDDEERLALDGEPQEICFRNRVCRDWMSQGRGSEEGEKTRHHDFPLMMQQKSNIAIQWDQICVDLTAIESETKDDAGHDHSMAAISLI